jgi:hypothetical protein
MQNPDPRARTPRQKWIIAMSVVIGLLFLGSIIWGYEIYLRRSLRETLSDRQWSLQGCMDYTDKVTFRRDGTVEVEQFGVGQTSRGTGTWRLYGRDLLELEYVLRYDRYADEPPDPNIPPDTRRWHIAKITQDELIVENVRPIVYKRAK